MTGPPWRVERNQELRDDADGLFVPAADLPDAALGDAVVVTHGTTQRAGTVADLVDDPGRGRFVRITLH